MELITEPGQLAWRMASTARRLSPTKRVVHAYALQGDTSAMGSKDE
jgi:hypothetical protein